MSKKIYLVSGSVKLIDILKQNEFKEIPVKDFIKYPVCSIVIKNILNNGKQSNTKVFIKNKTIFFTNSESMAIVRDKRFLKFGKVTEFSIFQKLCNSPPTKYWSNL